jgi:hypothetical protein
MASPIVSRELPRRPATGTACRAHHCRIRVTLSSCCDHMLSSPPSRDAPPRFQSPSYLARDDRAAPRLGVGETICVRHYLFPISASTERAERIRLFMYTETAQLPASHQGSKPSVLDPRTAAWGYHCGDRHDRGERERKRPGGIWGGGPDQGPYPRTVTRLHQTTPVSTARTGGPGQPCPLLFLQPPPPADNAAAARSRSNTITGRAEQRSRAHRSYHVALWGDRLSLRNGADGCLFSM